MAIFKDLRKRRFWRHLAVQSFACVGFIGVLVGLFDVIFPDVVPLGGRRLAIYILVIAIFYGFMRAWPRPIEQSYDSPNTKIRLVEGNLFEQPGHLVIGMCDTFDTDAPSVIANSSVQAQFTEAIFNGDVREVDRLLEEALVGFSPIGTINKPGKQSKYEVGTVAAIRGEGRRYFCVAYTEMNQQNEARGSIDGVWRSLDNLWKSVCAHANGDTVAIPVIGGGQARISQLLPAQDSIRFIALSFILASRKEKICDELDIIVQPADYDKLDRLEIQAFLRSLRPS